MAGAYLGSYASVNVGFCANGFTLEFQNFAEEVNETDQFGQTLIDTIYRGLGVTLEWESKIWKQGSVLPFAVWSGLTGVLGMVASSAAPIGRLASNVAQAMVLTVVASTPAAGTTPSANSVTASKSIIAPGQSLKLLFSSKVRSVPVRLLCLPSQDGSGNVTSLVLA